MTRHAAPPTRTRVHLSHRWVVVGAVVAVLGGSLAFAAAVPPYGSADEAAHVDYAVQVWHGHLPVFEDGLELELEHGARPPVQWTAQHPPAFYLLLAPVVGPLVDAGHPVQAALAGRAVTGLLAALTVLAVGWAARWVVGRAGLLAASAALVAAADVWVLRLGGAVYNDILQVLVVTLLLGTAARIIRLDRVGGVWWVPWLALPCLAALTRASGIPLAALALTAVAVGALRGRRPFRALAGRIGLPLLVALAGAVWFYRRNVRLTGTWTGAQPEWAAEHINRRSVPVVELLVDPGFYRTSFRQFGLAPGTGDLANALLLVVPVVVAAVLLARPSRFRLRSLDPPGVVVHAMLVLAVGGITLMQVLYVANGGGATGRYFAVLLLPLSIAVAFALTSWRLAWVPVLVWVVVRAADLVLDVRAVLVRYDQMALPSLPPAVAWGGVGLFVAGMLVAVAAVAREGAAPRDGSPTALASSAGAR
jgi:hypothetical protein